MLRKGTGDGSRFVGVQGAELATTLMGGKEEIGDEYKRSHGSGESITKVSIIAAVGGDDKIVLQNCQRKLNDVDWSHAVCVSVDVVLVAD